MPINTCVPCRGDHTYADSYITVLPKGTEFVVFSIDGSFAASVSIMGSDPKVRAGAVDVVRSAAGVVGSFYAGVALDLRPIDLWLSFQALARPRLPHYLRHGPPRHAEAEGGGVVSTAQLPPRDRLLLRWARSRPAAAQGQLPEIPHHGRKPGAVEAWS